MIIMSYGGVPLHHSTPNDELIDELAKAAIAICAHGIFLDDSSTDNLLVNDNKVAVIDFESALIVEPPSRAALERYKAEIEGVAEKVRISGNLKALLP
jgi:predicted Ser/Thr protein kinase